MNANQAAQIYDVTKMTIRRWIKAGKLPADPAGYFDVQDLEDLVQQKVDRLAKGPKKEAAASKKKPKRTSSSATTTESEPEEVPKRSIRRKQTRKQDLTEDELERKYREDGTPLFTNDYVASLAKSEESVLATRVKTEEKRGVLIKREVVADFLGKRYAIDVNNFQSLGINLSPEIMAVCEIDDTEIQLKVEQKIQEEVFKVLGLIKRETDRFLDELETDMMNGADDDEEE